MATEAPSFATYLANAGTLSEAQFKAALPRAQAAVDLEIYPNVVGISGQAAYDRAVCMAVDLVDSPSVTSERVGNTQLDYADVQTIESTIRAALVGSGLLYRGI